MFRLLWCLVPLDALSAALSGGSEPFSRGTTDRDKKHRINQENRSTEGKHGPKTFLNGDQKREDKKRVWAKEQGGERVKSVVYKPLLINACRHIPKT